MEVGLVVLLGVLAWLWFRVIGPGFKEGLRGEAPAPSESRAGEGVDYSLEVVGESNYGRNFKKILGKHAGTDEEVHLVADVILEDGNKYDDQAVVVQVQAMTVGYLSRADARRFRRVYAGELRAGLGSMQVPARVYAGGEDETFSVSLALRL